MQKIQDITEQMINLEKRMSIEIQKKQEAFFYKINRRKVRFDKATREYHKTLMTKVRTYLYHAGILKTWSNSSGTACRALTNISCIPSSMQKYYSSA